MMKLIILCGPPGSGKTTYSKKIAEKYNAIRLSFDEMGCVQHKDLLQPVIETLQAGNSVVVDALYSRAQYRKMILDATKNINCRHILIYMETPLEDCVYRNENRPNPLPEFMIRDIYNNFEFPELEEGWDDIWYFK